MRTAELLGAPVLDGDGRKRGFVIEIRTRAEDETGRTSTLVVDGLVIGPHRWRLFGYERRGERGPAVLRAILRLLHRHTRYARYDQVDIEAGAGVHLHVPWHELQPFHEIPN